MADLNQLQNIKNEDNGDTVIKANYGDDTIAFDTKAKTLSKNLYGVVSDDKWGIFNNDGHCIISFIFDDLACLQDKIVVLKDGKIGILDREGRIVITPSYASIECVALDNGIYENKDGLLFGQYNKKCVFDSAGFCLKLRRNRVYSHENQGIVISGEENFSFDNFFILKNDNYSELFSIKDGIIPNSKFETIIPLTNNCFAVKQNSKWGVFRVNGMSMDIPCENDRIIYEGGDVVLICKNDLWGATEFGPLHGLDVDIPIQFKEIKILDDDQLYFGVYDKRLSIISGTPIGYTLVDMKGKPFRNMSFFNNLGSQCELFNNNFDMILTSYNSKYGFISADGYVTIPFIYDEVLRREDNLFDIRIEDKWGVLDVSGREVVSMKYSERIPISWAGTVVFNTLTERYGVLAEDGSELVPSIYEHIKIENDFIFYGYGGYEEKNETTGIFDAKWGCMNIKGQKIINPTYNCFTFDNDFILAGRDGDMSYHTGLSFCTEKFRGVYDLYTKNGDLIIGGFRKFEFEHDNKIFILFWGGSWEDYTPHGEGSWEDSEYEGHMKFMYNDGLWLFLDKDLRTIIRNRIGHQHQIHKGSIYTFNDSKIIKEVNGDHIPMEYLAKGFQIISKNILYICDSNYWRDMKDGAIPHESAIDIVSGKQIPFYERIRHIDNSLFYVAETKTVGIRSFERSLLNCEYLFLTIPVKGYYFAGEEIDNKTSQVFLKSVYNTELNIKAINCIETSTVISHVQNELFQIQFNGDNHSIKDIVLVSHSIFDEDFIQMVSSVESNHPHKSLNDKSDWFASDSRFWPELHYSCEDREWDKPNYSRDTWYALTDGAYGDYPGGDVDYDGLGF